MNDISLTADVQTQKPVRAFGITSITMKRLLTQENPANLIALYCFLLHTGNRQRTQIVFANEWFIGQALKWSTAKVSYVKKQLRALKLIETVARRDAKGRVQKHYVRLAFAADVQSLKIQSLKKPEGGNFRDNACDTILNASEGIDACEIKSKEDSGFTAVVSASQPSASPKGTAEPVKKKIAAVWKPDTRPAWEKLDALPPPRDFPSECEFDEHLDAAGLHLVPTYRSDLYRELCERKWRDWNGRLLKWEPIRDWKKYVTALDEKMWDTLGSGRKADAAAPEIKLPAAAPDAAVARPAVHHAAACPPAPAPAIIPTIKAAAPAVAVMKPPEAAPRPAYREAVPTEGDDIPAELETATTL